MASAERRDLIGKVAVITGAATGIGRASALLFSRAGARVALAGLEPDRLEITRRENPHVAFGYGIHFCLGAALARLEGQIAIGTIVRRFSSIRLTTDTLEWRPSQALRGLRSLPVIF